MTQCMHHMMWPLHNLFHVKLHVYALPQLLLTCRAQPVVIVALYAVQPTAVIDIISPRTKPDSIIMD